MPLYDYQTKYLEGLGGNAIMAASTGTGKSQMSLAHYKLYSDGSPILILAPASKCKTLDWDREVEMAGLDKIEYQVVSYDKFARRPQDYFKTGMVLIADEVHFIKNPTSKRGRATIIAAKHAKQFIGLSATPLPNGWKDLASYMIIWGAVKHKTEFMNRFVRIDRSPGFPLFLGYNEEPVMKNFWQGIAKPMERQMKSQSIPIDIELSPARLAEYIKVEDDRVTPDGELLDSAPLLHARLRQMLAPDRTTELRAILDSTDEHIIVFYNYNTERDEILKVLRDYKFKIFEQSGHASNLPPREKWDTMKQSVTIAQYQSASVAIELQYASISIYFSPTYSYANFHQSMGRTRRIGQKKTPLFYLFRIKDTIDEAVWSCLKEKKDFDDKVVKNY